MDSVTQLFRLLFLVWTLSFSNVLGALPSSAMSGGLALEDASEVTWAHAVNSRDALEKASGSGVDFLEADVSMGHVTGNKDVLLIPVMAHPPSKTSDISLDDWLSTIASRGLEKGLKLDFKSIEVVEPSLLILQKYAPKFQLNDILWLSADVLPGPVRSPNTPVKADQFLELCSRYFPGVRLSLGWTTRWNRRLPIASWQYEWKHVRQMADTVRCLLGNKYPSITFNVRGIFASRSIQQLQWLLNVIPRSVLTVWSENGDAVDSDDFVRIRKAFSKERVFYDVPETLRPRHKNKNIAVASKKRSILDDRWLTVLLEKENDCESYTYANSSRIMFGKSSNILVLRRSLLLVDNKSNFTVTGRIRFFAGEHALNPVHWQHKLKMVLVDVNRFPKHAMAYSKKKLTFTVKDTDALWSTVNSSVLYTFDHQYFETTSACRMFKLIVGTNIVFQAWTTPCDESYEDSPVEELSRISMSEIVLEEQLSKKGGTFLIGFYSYGEEYVLLHDFSVTDQAETVNSIFGFT